MQWHIDPLSMNEAEKNERKNSTVKWNSNTLRYVCVHGKRKPVHSRQTSTCSLENQFVANMLVQCACSVCRAHIKLGRRICATEEKTRDFFFRPEKTLPPCRRTHCRPIECTVIDVWWIWWCEWWMECTLFYLHNIGLVPMSMRTQKETLSATKLCRKKNVK